MHKSIGCVGAGFVGGSIITVMSEKGLDVYAYDKGGKYPEAAKYIPRPWPGNLRPDSITDLVESCEQVAGFSRIYFVCVPTPMMESGECDLSIIESVLTELAAVPGERIAIVKSTVPPGSTEKWNKMFADQQLHVVFSPEFLREASALDDMRNQDRIILGGPRPWINKVKQLFQGAFPNVPIVKTSSTTAECVKYFTNCFLATKVSLANEFCQICEALDASGLDVDYDKCVEYATMDQRLGKSHWAVPGPMVADDGSGRYLRGFGGSCICKDIRAFTHVAKQLGVDPKVLISVWSKNEDVRPERDWENLVGRAVSAKKQEE